ncbi:Uncharacterised protein [Clostridioides difficile]|nr:Uncharacterised protein [Clostridioides difficile]
MKNIKKCPKCGSTDIVCVPDNAHKYLANSIAITKTVTVQRVPVSRYVCCSCGYLENWIETNYELNIIKNNFK